MRSLLIFLSVITTTLLGGMAYFVLFYFHPYMGGFPDIAVFAQSATETILNNTTTSLGRFGGVLPTALFPFLFLETVVLRLANGLEPITNLWILQQLIPFLYVLLYFIIGRNLTKSSLGGILTAMLAGMVADIPIAIDQGFSRFLSTYTMSFLFFLSLIAYLPRLLVNQYSRANMVFLIIILASGTLLSHHYFGVVRFAIIVLLFVLVAIISLWKKRNKAQRSTVVLGSLAIVFLLFTLTNITLLPGFFHRYGIYVLPKGFSEQTSILSSGPIESVATIVQSFFQDIPLWGLSTLIENSLVALIALLSVIGSLVVLRSMKRAPEEWSAIQRWTAMLLLFPAGISIVLFMSSFVIPTRFLRETSALMLPFAAWFMYRGLESLHHVIKIPVFVLFISASSWAWFPPMFAFEKTLNTSWANVEMLQWARTNMVPDAQVLTDPFTAHILQASVPFLQDPLRFTPSGNQKEDRQQEEQRLLAGKAIIRMVDETSIRNGLDIVCPEYIAIDTVQSQQFFTMPDAGDLYRYPSILNVVFDRVVPTGQRITIFQPAPNVCAVKQ